MQLRLPHPLVLLLAGVAVAAVLTWIIPAGSYERRVHEETGREIVVGGTYKPVPAAPVSPMAAVLSVPRGIVAGAEFMV